MTPFPSPSPPSSPCVRPKNLRVYVQNVPVCTGTYGDVWNLHTEIFSACHTTHHTHTPHTPHTHQHAQPPSSPHTHTPQHTETDRQIKWTERERRGDERRETREGNTKDKMKDEEDEKTRRKKRQEKIKMRRVVCVLVRFLFFFKITRPSNNFEISKLPVTNPDFNFSGNFLFVRLQNKIIFELFW